MPSGDPSAEFARLAELTGLNVEAVAGQLGYSASNVYRWLRHEHPPNPAALKLLKTIVDGMRPRPAPRRTFTFIDLFAGIGGMRLALEATGGRCVFTSEWNAFSRQTYLANFPDGPDHPYIGDITQASPGDVPAHDLLVAGFPCQPFSIAGVSKKNALGRPHGFECKEQGNLFFTIAEILKKHRPPAFLLENVKNLQNHDGGNTFRVIMEVLRDDLGYEVHHRVINAKGYVPQNRERIFIVGFRKPTSFDFNRVKVADPTTGPTLQTILHPEDGSEPEDLPYTSGPKGTVADRYILTEHLWTYLQNYAAKHKALGHGFGFGLVRPDQSARTLSARYFKDGSEILIDRGRRKRPRRLTPRECARLMGFDWRGRRFEIPVSDTQAYKQFGNAVVVPVVQMVANAIVPHLTRITGGQQLSLLPVEDPLALAAS
jgi:DNA (cytosine-5)-methyltransferase 1